MNIDSSSSAFKARYLPAGDRALLVEYGNKINEEINDCVSQLALWLEGQAIAGIQEVVPTYCSLMICYEPSIITYWSLVQRLKEFTPAMQQGGKVKRKIWKIPCLYDGEDLPSMEEITHLSQKEIINIHSSVDYRIYMLGFLPGFVYLGGLDERIHAPRLQSPRVKIPEGSVAIGGGQTGIYPIVSPGGWRLIGRTPVKLYDVQREEPILCKAGEFIRFVPIDIAEYKRLEQAISLGDYQPSYFEEVAEK